MFDSFRSRFQPSPGNGVGPALSPPAHLEARGFAQFAETLSGLSFNGGLYRIHDEASRVIAEDFVARAFPSFSHRIYCFAYDWLGRQFALDATRQSRAEALVLMFEPGTAQALEIPAGLLAFHDVELVDHADAALASTFFEAWMAGPGSGLGISRSTCIGYKVPLFLGGRDTLDNLEAIDLQIYWHLSAELIQGTRQLPPGSTIASITLD